MKLSEQGRFPKESEGGSAAGLTSVAYILPPSLRVDLPKQVVLQRALARIGEAGRRFAQCLFMQPR